jgi:glycosyltransferase involved in cell wall biosynthesis
MMPLYLKKASVVISVSKITTDDFQRILITPPGKVLTVYFGPAKYFKRVEDEATLSKIRFKYKLPHSFIFSLSKYGGDNRKNFDCLIESYRIYHRKTSMPCKLVVGGNDCDKFRRDYKIPMNGYGKDIIFPGWIEQADLPAVYSLASLYLYPSHLEAFPIPITESMACGTPIITSNMNGLKEIAGDAALLVSPDNAEELSEAIYRVLMDADLQKSLSAQGLARSQNYSWDKCAQETLAILEKIHVNSVRRFLLC